MKSLFAWLIGTIVLVNAAEARAQVGLAYADYDKYLTAAKKVEPLGDGLFGDKTNWYTGQTEFEQVDLEFPGIGLPITVSRRYAPMTKDGHSWHVFGLFGDWDLVLPYLAGTFPTSTGWQVTGAARCTVPTPRDNNYGSIVPPTMLGVYGKMAFSAIDYWQGMTLNVPGNGETSLVVLADANPNRPTGGATYTNGAGWMVSCLSATANGVPGEAFLATAPDGTTYKFNWIVPRRGSGETIQMVSVDPTGPSDSLPVATYMALPTEIKDRFGNTLTYTYDSVNKDRLISISSGSDGRIVSFTYDTHGNIATVSDGVRVWRYGYSKSPYGVDYLLSSVILPDSSSWTMDATGFANSSGVGGAHSDCTTPGNFNKVPVTVTMKHPSGASGIFHFDRYREGRTYVPFNCWSAGSVISESNLRDFWALDRKELNGPGITTSVWTVDYSQTGTNYCYTDLGAQLSCQASTPTTSITKLTNPDGSQLRYTFSNRYGTTEGSLVKTEVLTSTGAVLQTISNSYQESPANQLYPAVVGTNPCFRCGVAGETSAPLLTVQIVRQGVTFQRTNGAFDRFANPTSVVRSSTGGAGGNFSRTETIGYYHDMGKWVIGQVASVTDVGTGLVMSQTSYNSAYSLPASTSAFGAVQQSMTYNADGTLAAVKDGLGNTITLGNWYRGMPRQVSLPTGYTESAVVNPTGTIASTTDELGYTHTYGYDPIGRLASITYPSADTTAWNGTTRTFVSVATPEYGLPAGHWRQTEVTGNGRTSTYYDALWRPVLTLSEDTGIAESKSFVVTRYDSNSRVSFVSYPVTALVSVNDNLKGVSTTYDPLNRPVQVSQDSELGALLTTFQYLSGFKTKIVNPLGIASSSIYQVFDEPKTDAPVKVTNAEGLPEQQATTIVRDVFGKPLTITRSGN
jgi:YD repeat-containing protein